MKSREIFEKLGYEYNEEDNEIKGKIIYYLKAKHIPNRIDTKYINFTKITFALNGITIESWQTDAYIHRIKDFSDFFLTTEELNAISKHFEELNKSKGE